MEARSWLNVAWGSLLAAVIVLPLSSCHSVRRSDEDTKELFLGTPATRTPYDRKYEKVRKYLKEAFTKIRYKPEPPSQDYWQLPEETESLGTGDCEDFAIWLFAKLKNAGVSDIRLCIGKHVQGANVMHAWVIWYDGANAWILDPSVRGEPLNVKHSSLRFYIPYYSYDGDKKWTHRKPAARR